MLGFPLYCTCLKCKKRERRPCQADLCVGRTRDASFLKSCTVLPEEPQHGRVRGRGIQPNKTNSELTCCSDICCLAHSFIPLYLSVPLFLSHTGACVHAHMHTHTHTPDTHYYYYKQQEGMCAINLPGSCQRLYRDHCEV